MTHEFDVDRFINDALERVARARPAYDRSVEAAAYVAACNHLRMLRAASRYRPELVPSSLLLVLSHLETLRAEALDAKPLDALIDELYAALAAQAKEDPDEILERLRALGACGRAVRPEPDENGDTGWVVRWFDDRWPEDLAELWRSAVCDHIGDAWWLAARLGVARPALDAAVRRALVYAAEVREAAGLDGADLRRVAGTEALDYDAARDAARSAAESADADAAAARAAAAARSAAAESAAAESAAAAAAEAARAAAWAATAAEAEQQREDLLGLWPQIYTALTQE